MNESEKQRFFEVIKDFSIEEIMAAISEYLKILEEKKEGGEHGRVSG